MRNQTFWKNLAIVLVAGGVIAGCTKNNPLAMLGDPGAYEAKAVTKRRKLMRGIRSDMKRIKTALKQGGGWVVKEQIKQAAGAMYKKARKIKKAFKENTLRGKTTATSKIWKNRAKFALAADALAANAAVLAQIHVKGSMGQIKRGVGMVGKQCGACHKAFRKKKKKKKR